MTRPLSPRSDRRRSRALIAVPMAALLAGVVTGCGDDDEALPDAAHIVATDYAFEDLPDRIGTETTLTMRNDSSAEVHELVAFRLPDDVDGTAEEILERPETELGFLDGEPALVVVAAPGGEPVVPIGDGTLPEAGRYLLFCGIPTGADVDEFMAAAAESDGPPDVAGGPPHFVHGMAATVDVVAS